MRCRSAFRDELTSHLPRLNIVLEEVGGRVLVCGEGGERASHSRRRGSHMSMIPAGMCAWQHSDYIGMFRDLVLDLEPDRIHESVQEKARLSAGFRASLYVFPIPIYCVLQK